MHDASPFRSVLPGRPRTVEPGAVPGLAGALSALRGALAKALLEACRYACGSTRSRLHQRAALRELDDRLLRDVGVAPGQGRRGCHSAGGSDGYGPL